MNLFMTKTTNRNNNKPLVGFVTCVMIVYGFIVAIITIQQLRRNQISIIDSSPNSFISSESAWILFIQISVIYFTFILSPFPNCFFAVLFAFFSLVVFYTGFFPTLFTDSTKAIFAFFRFIKFISRFDFLAFGTSFRYDCLRHIRFLKKRLCLEPFAAQSASGSLYYSTSNEEGK